MHSTSNWEVLRQMERERQAIEAVGGEYRPIGGRPPCRRCLALAPQEAKEGQA